jgi:hypothetical protein
MIFSSKLGKAGLIPGDQVRVEGARTRAAAGQPNSTGPRKVPVGKAGSVAGCIGPVDLGATLSSASIAGGEAGRAMNHILRMPGCSGASER